MGVKTYVFGHTNPDTDSITSAICMANLQNKLGNESEACRLGKVNKETAYALKKFNFEEPTLVESLTEENSVILVDSNEFSQSIPDIEKAKIKMVVDHHRIQFKTNEPIFYLSEPVGCTATIIYKLYKQNDIEITPDYAGLMLSAIISDTLLFKSPTCTEQDKQIATKLAEIANVDLNEYGLALLKAGTNISDFSPYQIINIDSKEFVGDDYKFVVSQVNTADINDVFARKELLEKEMVKEITDKNLDLYLFVATDVLNANSKVISLGNKANVIEKAYGKSLDNNSALLEGIVSRKKEIVPPIISNIHNL